MRLNLYTLLLDLSDYNYVKESVVHSHADKLDVVHFRNFESHVSFFRPRCRFFKVSFIFLPFSIVF